MSIVSVIVPIFNTESYLKICLDSLIRQTYSDLQIILVDDGSTDSSLSIAKQYAERDERIKLYSQSHQGQSAARNLGLHYATGDYISFIDSDDYLDTDFFETTIPAFRPGIDVIQIGYRRVQEGYVLTKRCPHTFYHYTAPWSRLYRRDFFTNHNLSFVEGVIYEDVIFSLDIWAAKPHYTLLRYTGYNYRLNPQSTTSIRNQKAENILYETMRQRYLSVQGWQIKFLILYTFIRLKIHFLLKH